jgi:hypothetical protein
MKLISMTKFVLETNELTRAEFCDLYLKPPRYYEPLNYLDTLQIDVNRLRIINEYAQFLAKEIMVNTLTNELGFTFLESMENGIEFINNGYCIICTGSGFWLSSYDTTEGLEVKTVEDLIGLDIEVNFKFK